MPVRKSRKRLCKTVYKKKSKSRSNSRYIKIKICKSRSSKKRRSIKNSKRRYKKRSRNSRSRKKISRRRISRKLRSRKRRSKKKSLRNKYNFNNGYNYSMNHKKKYICNDIGCKLCQNTFVIDPIFIQKVVPILRKSDEISGSLKIKNQNHQIIDVVTGEQVTNMYECKSGCDNIFRLSSSKVKNGDGETAEMIIKRAGYHTHPEPAYVSHNCSLGWPSKDDYITFLETFLRYNTVLHIVVSLEGFYILTIPYKTIKIFESLSQNDAKDLLLNAVKKFINIDKNGYSMQKGYKKNNLNINDPKSYQKFVNNIRLPVDKDVPSKLVNLQPFRLDFIFYKDMGVKMFPSKNSIFEVYRKYGCPYNPETNKVEIKKTNTIGIKFSYPSIKNNCSLDDL